MAVLTKHHPLGGGWTSVDGIRSKVLRKKGGRFLVQSPHDLETARVRFHAFQDLALVEQAGISLRLAFRKGEATFVWEERTYHIGTMIDGDIAIDESGRSVVRGNVTTSGVRLRTVATELLPLIRALAWVLTLRSESVGRDSRYEPAAASAG